MNHYIVKLEDFLKNDVNDIITKLSILNPTAEKSQINSWITLINDIKQSNVSLLPKDVVVGIEVNLPIDGMGVDLMIMGKDKDDSKHSFLIEAKQWVDSNVYTYEFGESRSETQTLHPQIQLARHVMGFKDYTNIGAEFITHSFVFTRNLSDQAINHLININPIKEFKSIPMIISMNDIISEISKILVSGSDDIFDLFTNMSYKPSKSIIAAMESMVSKYEPFILTDEQENVVKQIFDAFNSGKKIIRITGVAGSGKTAILLHTYIKLVNKQSDDIRPIFISGAQNTKLYQSLFREVERSFSFSFSLDKMVGKTIGHKYYLCMDEAQHNESGIISNMINRNAQLILCYDEGQTINANNALVELKQLETRSDFVSINLQNSVRYSGSQVFEKNVKKVLNGNMEIDPDFLYDFKIFDTIEELENHTIDLIKKNPKSTIAITGLLSNDASAISNRPNSKIFIDWGYQGECRWIPYVESKDYLQKNNGKLWVGTWWLPGLDVDYVSVIVGGDAKMTINGIEAVPHGAKHYKMMISIAEKLNYPKHLFVNKQSFGKTVQDTVKSSNNIINYAFSDANLKRIFIQEFSELLKNNYYILLTRGRKGCYVCFSNK